MRKHVLVEQESAARDLEKIYGVPYIASASGGGFGNSRARRRIGGMRGRVVHMLEFHLYDSLTAWGRDDRSGSLALCGQEVDGLLFTENEDEVTCRTCRSRLERIARYTASVEANREVSREKHELRKALNKEKRKRTTILNRTRKIPLKIHYGDPRNRSTIVCGMVTGRKGTYELEKVTCRRCRKIVEDQQKRDDEWNDNWDAEWPKI